MFTNSTKLKRKRSSRKITHTRSARDLRKTSVKREKVKPNRSSLTLDLTSLSKSDNRLTPRKVNRGKGFRLPIVSPRKRSSSKKELPVYYPYIVLRSNVDMRAMSKKTTLYRIGSIPNLPI